LHPLIGAALARSGTRIRGSSLSVKGRWIQYARSLQPEGEPAASTKQAATALFSAARRTPAQVPASRDPPSQPHAVASATIAHSSLHNRSHRLSQSRSECWGQVRGNGVVSASRTIRRWTPNFRATPLMVPTPNSYSRRIASNNSTSFLLLKPNSLRAFARNKYPGECFTGGPWATSD
jgi:hypothetical protein